jgi:hypothetical protein
MAELENRRKKWKKIKIFIKWNYTM